MWELDYKGSWAHKNWCFWTMVLEKTLESPRRSNQSILKEIWTEASILWPPDMKSQLTGKDPDAGKDWRREEKGTTEDEIVGWHHRFNGHEFEQALGVGDGQGRLACRSPWVAKSWTKLSYLTKLTFIMIFCKVKSCVVKVLCAKGQFSCQSQRKAMPKNVWITIQLRSCHMLARLYSKSFKLGFSSTWMKNFQMYKLGFEEAEEPEIKYPIWITEEENSRKTSTSVSLTTLKLLTVWITTNCGKFLKRWEYQITLPVSWETCMQVKKQQSEPYLE